MWIFSILIIWELRFKVHTSFETQNSVLLLSLSLHSSSLTFKLLSMASYGCELLLDSSSPWSGISNHLSSFFIPLPLIFKKQRTPLIKKIQGLQAPHGATSYSMWGEIKNGKKNQRIKLAIKLISKNGNIILNKRGNWFVNDNED